MSDSIDEGPLSDYFAELTPADTCGTPSRGRYVQGCRCDGCRKAERDYKRLYRLHKALQRNASPECVWSYLENMGGDR